MDIPLVKKLINQLEKPWFSTNDNKDGIQVLTLVFST
jgi:hypothetical protein